MKAISIFEHTHHWTVTWMDGHVPMSQNFLTFEEVSRFVENDLLA